MEEAVVWIVIGVLCLIAEALTVGFVAAYFGVGAFAAAAAAWLGAPIGGQLAVFAIVSVALLAFTRRTMLDALQGKDEPVPSNVDVMLGKSGIVTIPISNDLSTGQIRVGTEFWTARLLGDGSATVPAGAKVEIVEVKGVTALVRLREESGHAATHGA
ncbi:MAG: NfeD family protein [Dermatophilaceae bacterium]